MTIFVNTTVVGVSPLLLRAFTNAAQMEATDSTRSSVVGDRGTPREQAEAELYRGADGRTLIIPSPNLFRAIIDGGSYFKAGKSKVTTQKSSMIPSCIAISEIEIPIKHNEPWTVDIRPVRIPATGGRILRYRPMFQDWELSFTLEVDTDIITTKLVRDIVDAAGKRVGLGDFRPATKGPFGRFVVTRWAVENRETKIRAA